MGDLNQELAMVGEVGADMSCTLAWSLCFCPWQELEKKLRELSEHLKVSLTENEQGWQMTSILRVNRFHIAFVLQLLRVSFRRSVLTR